MNTIISSNIRRIRASIPSEVQYIVVSKYRPIEQLQEAYDAGARVFAESRPAELQSKAAVLPKDIEWHFIGHLQTNKLKMVLPYCSLVQSVDSIHLMEAIDRWGRQQGKVVNVLMEIHVAMEESKQGFTPEEALAFFRDGTYASYPNMCICGLMGMASNTDDEARIHEDFGNIHQLFMEIRHLCPQLENFKELSIGMSQDYDIALQYGATMVRIGSASFE